MKGRENTHTRRGGAFRVLQAHRYTPCDIDDDVDGGKSIGGTGLSRVGGTRVRLTGGGVRTWPTKTKSIKHVTFSAVSTDADALRPFRPLLETVYACAVDVAVVGHYSPDDRR